jgi:hypothetical protein
VLYRFRDRVEPFLDDWHAQLIAWAIFENLTTAQRGSLDGTFIAALASRHRLLSCRRVDQRLVLLRVLIWFDDNHRSCHLATLLEDVAAWLRHTTGDPPVSPDGVSSPGADALAQLVHVLEPVLDGLTSLPTHVPAWMPATATGRKRVLKRYEQARDRLTQRLRPYQQKTKWSKKDKEAVNRLRTSGTDPDAALGRDKMGTYRPLYDLLLVQATDAPLTLAWEVLGCNNDQGQIQAMMEKTKKQVNHHLKELLIDGGFLNVSDVVWCENNHITIYAPPAKVEAVNAEMAKALTAKVEALKAEVAKVEALKVEAAKVEAAKVEAAKVEAAKVEAAKVEAAKVEAAKVEAAKALAAKVEAAKIEAAKVEEVKLPKSAFRYASEEQVYYCPQGKRLEPVSRTTDKRKGGVELPVIVHQARVADCRACPQRAGCTSSTKKGRVVKRYEGEEALERLEQRMHDPAAQQIYRLRAQTVELGNADLKEHRGLRTFRGFGRKRARAQAGLVLLASNGLKIVSALQQRQKAGALPSQKKQVA